MLLLFLSYHLVYISELRNTYQSSQLPVTDDETTLHKFCVKLETVLRHEQKGKVTFNHCKRKPWLLKQVDAKLLEIMHNKFTNY